MQETEIITQLNRIEGMLAAMLQREQPRRLEPTDSAAAKRRMELLMDASETGRKSKRGKNEVS
jgi:hypothetical protein